MRRAPIALLFALAAAAILALPLPAYAIPIHQHHFKQVDGRMYEVTTVVHVAPPDSDQDGIRNGKDGCPAVAGPDGGCPPPKPAPAPAVDSPVVVAAAPATTSYAPAPTTSAGGCVGMEAESGSAGYGAMSSSGYIGCYQIGPEHYAAGGSCAGLGTDPAGQDACAAVICQTEGAGAWTNPAGENPCGRLGG